MELPPHSTELRLNSHNITINDSHNYHPGVVDTVNSEYQREVAELKAFYALSPVELSDEILVALRHKHNHSIQIVVESSLHSLNCYLKNSKQYSYSVILVIKGFVCYSPFSAFAFERLCYDNATSNYKRYLKISQETDAEINRSTCKRVHFGHFKDFSESNGFKYKYYKGDTTKLTVYDVKHLIEPRQLQGISGDGCRNAFDADTKQTIVVNSIDDLCYLRAAIKRIFQTLCMPRWNNLQLELCWFDLSERPLDATEILISNNCNIKELAIIIKDESSSATPTPPSGSAKPLVGAVGASNNNDTCDSVISTQLLTNNHYNNTNFIDPRAKALQEKLRHALMLAECKERQRQRDALILPGFTM